MHQLMALCFLDGLILQSFNICGSKLKLVTELLLIVFQYLTFMEKIYRKPKDLTWALCFACEYFRHWISLIYYVVLYTKFHELFIRLDVSRLLDSCFETYQYFPQETFGILQLVLHLSVGLLLQVLSFQFHFISSLSLIIWSLLLWSSLFIIHDFIKSLFLIYVISNSTVLIISINLISSIILRTIIILLSKVIIILLPLLSSSLFYYIFIYTYHICSSHA